MTFYRLNSEANPRRGRLLRLVFGAAVAAVLLTGCAGSEDTSGSTTSADSSGSAVGGAFEPIAVEHVFGTTEVTDRPERIVSLDPQWTDVLLAMGITPVGYISSPQFGETGTFPWQGELLADASPIAFTDGIPVEAVAALSPDLVLGTYVFTSQADYDQLSVGFDVVAAPTDAQVQKWEDLAVLTGQIVGDPAGAQRIIDEVEDEVTATAADLSGLKGRTIAFANYYAAGNQIVVLSDPDDGANVLFASLGLDLAPGVVAAGAGANGRTELSLEQISALDGDILLALTNDTDTITGWEQLPAVRAGSALVIDMPTAWALNTPTPLSIPWVLDVIGPTLEKAADR